MGTGGGLQRRETSPSFRDDAGTNTHLRIDAALCTAICWVSSIPRY